MSEPVAIYFLHSQDPMGLLSQILTNEKRGAPEARLLWASGKETMLACYHVGIYSDQELIGQGNKKRHI